MPPKKKAAKKKTTTGRRAAKPRGRSRAPAAKKRAAKPRGRSRAAAKEKATSRRRAAARKKVGSKRAPAKRVKLPKLKPQPPPVVPFVKPAQPVPAPVPKPAPMQKQQFQAMRKLLQDSKRYADRADNALSKLVLAYYGSEGYRKINKPLLGLSKRAMTKENESAWALIQQFLLSGPVLSGSVVLYRGVKPNKPLTVGSVVQNPMPLSTSYTKEVALQPFFIDKQKACCLLVLIVPEGVHAFAMEAMGGALQQQEAEILLPAGTTWVVFDKKVSSGVTTFTLQCSACYTSELFQGMPAVKKKMDSAVKNLKLKDLAPIVKRFHQLPILLAMAESNYAYARKIMEQQVQLLVPTVYPTKEKYYRAVLDEVISNIYYPGLMSSFPPKDMKQYLAAFWLELAKKKSGPQYIQEMKEIVK